VTNIEEIYNGINKSLLNSIELIDDAEYLFQNKRFARAYALFQLGIEEIGKVTMLFRLVTTYILDGKEIDLNKMKDHKHKYKETFVYDLFMLFALSHKNKTIDKSLLDTLIYEIQNIDLINELKNFSLYTSLIDNKFKIPKDIISEKLVISIRYRAMIRLEVVKSFAGTFDSMNYKEYRDSLLQEDSKYIYQSINEYVLSMMNEFKKAYT